MLDRLAVTGRNIAAGMGAVRDEHDTRKAHAIAWCAETAKQPQLRPWGFVWLDEVNRGTGDPADETMRRMREHATHLCSSGMNVEQRVLPCSATTRRAGTRPTAATSSRQRTPGPTRPTPHHAPPRPPPKDTRRLRKGTMETKTGPAPNPPLVPDTLTVVLIDDTPNHIAIVHENEWRPYGRRTVQITLTEEQRRRIAPRSTGMIGGKHTYEDVLQAWLEPATEPLPADPA